MRLTKILFTLLITVIMTLTLASCSGNDGDVKADDEQSNSGQNNNEENNNEENNNEENNDNPVPDTVTYNVSWYDENSVLLGKTTVEKGSVPSYSYIKSDTAEWDYTFEGWSATAGGSAISSLPVCNSDVSYYAAVSQVKQKYTVTFNSMGGSAVNSQTVEYGSLATKPDDPTYEGYNFVSWCTDTECTTQVDFSKVITGNVEYFASWNEIIPIPAAELLTSLLNGYSVSAYSFIPDTMTAGYSKNLVDADSIVSDYSNFVSISDIQCGFGEQWNMVLDNLNQSEVFFKILSTVDSIATSSIVAFNNYLDKNPSNTANYSFDIGEYGIVIHFDGQKLTYVVEFTANVPVFGMQTVQIALSTDLEETQKTARVQVGDANAFSYSVTDSSYVMAVKYAGVRTSIVSIKADENGTVTGNLYEYIEVEAATISSAAEFVITEEYVSVVGNKASGMIGFTGYIAELYNTGNGKLVGYEVQETASVLFVTVTYDTLWFNLEDVDGIESIKYVEENGDQPAQFFVNGSSIAWSAMKYGDLSTKKESRRFDIEFRTQYVYSYDEATGEYTEHKISVPMIFVQEEKYSTFAEDIKEQNGINIDVTILEDDLKKMLDDYDVMIPVFIENKSKITSEDIVKYIGDKISFE